MSKSPQPKPYPMLDEEGGYHWKPEVELNDMKTSSNFNWVAAIVLGLILLLALTGCSRKTVAPIVEPVYIHDTTETVRMVHDSTYIDRWHTQWLSGDTVFIHDSIDRWHSVIKNDTAWMYREVPVLQKVPVEVEKKLNWWQKFRMRAGDVLLIAAILGLLYLDWRLWRRR